MKAAHRMEELRLELEAAEKVEEEQRQREVEEAWRVEEERRRVKEERWKAEEEVEQWRLEEERKRAVEEAEKQRAVEELQKKTELLRMDLLEGLDPTQEEWQDMGAEASERMIWWRQQKGFVRRGKGRALQWGQWKRQGWSPAIIAGMVVRYAFRGEWFFFPL